MAKIILAPYGSLGDLHPFLALALELRKRGHEVSVVTNEQYREKIESLGFPFITLRPTIDHEDREILKEVMHGEDGSEILITKYLLPEIGEQYKDLAEAAKDADLLIAGEVVFASHSVAEKLGIRFVTTTLAPLSMLSAFEPNIFPNAKYLRHLNFLGRPFQTALLFAIRQVLGGWLADYRKFRGEIGLDRDHNPIIGGKFSKDLHLAMFSEAFGKRRSDWPPQTVQTGFCFYDGSADMGPMPDELNKFVTDGEPPIVFTLGSAAVMDPGSFFEESIKAAKKMSRRAVILYGIFDEPPAGLDELRVGFDYAPYGELFPAASCVVHQGGVGTTAQVLRAGVPHLIMPYSHDQPDNAERCVRSGVARTLERGEYNAETAARELDKILSDPSYGAKAKAIGRIIETENGTAAACDAIEDLLDRE